MRSNIFLCCFIGHGKASKQELLEGVREAVGVYYNYSGANVACYDLRAGVNEESRIVEYVPVLSLRVCAGSAVAM